MSNPSDPDMEKLFQLIDDWRPSEAEWNAVAGFIERIKLEAFSNGCASVSAFITSHKSEQDLRLANKPSEL